MSTVSYSQPFIILSAALVFTTASWADDRRSEDAAPGPADIVKSYHQTLEAGDLDGFTKTLSSQIIMYNCTGKDYAEWQPHLFLSGGQVHEWATFFVNEAGPHQGSAEIVAETEYNGLSIVVARGDGANKFRSWSDETSVWLVGNIESEWKIAGFCLVDVQNPSEAHATD
ncbi:MAG: hypothetical protein AAFW68_08300 [Pseudomonadota bacterium]